MTPDIAILKNINTILERDSTTTTYKFALLRGVIEVIQENSPYIKKQNEHVEIPFLLLLEKWLIFYYGIYTSTQSIPQINGDSKLAFEDHLKAFIGVYEPLGGITTFYSDIRSGKVPEHVRPMVVGLLKVLRKVIYNMPMRHIGFSVHQREYSIFQKSPNKRVEIGMDKPFNLAALMFEFGTFKLDTRYFDAFETFGHFLIGTSGIINRWSTFSANASKGSISKEAVLSKLTDVLETKRFTNEARQLVLDSDQKRCVWSGKKYDSDNLCIDHVLPFSVYYNNDLWNLMPSTALVNSRKSDKIPSEEKFLNAKDRIINCWNHYMSVYPSQFMDQLKISLTGELPTDHWQQVAYEALIEKSKYLVDKRGLQIWS